jgi:STE24 endopeptidase
LPPRPASIVPPPGPAPALRIPLRDKVKPSAVIELGLALPWLWWSYLSLQFVGLPSDTLYWILIWVWILSAAAVMWPRTEYLLATKVHGLRPPSAMELQRLGPAWWAVCTAAKVDPNKYRVWIYEGPEATAPPPPGTTIAVSNWSTYNLPQPMLEAVLAHELAHHLALPPRLSLLIYWFGLPARGLAKFIVASMKIPVLSTVVKVVIGFFAFGVLLVWYFTEFDLYVAMMLSPMFAPFVVPWAARAGERYADRMAADLGYGVLLCQIFSGREAERGFAGHSAGRQSVTAFEPIESARLRSLEKYMQSLTGGQPPSAPARS